MQGTTVDAEGVFSYRDNLKISHAVKVANTIYISGQVALDPDGNLVGRDNIEAQAEYIWDNIQKVLQSAGSSLDDVVKMFQFVVGTENFQSAVTARRRIFSKDPLPCSTSIVVSGLFRPDLLLEVDVVAVVKD